jgi:hypothetical protein
MTFDLGILLVYWLSIYAFSYLLTTDEGLEPIRNKVTSWATLLPVFLFHIINKLLSCIYCMSFWSGLVVGYFVFGWWTFIYALSCFGFVRIFHK